MDKEHCYAFIDSQNVHLGIKSLGWDMNWARFRIYLAEKYSVTKAYVFIGYLPKNQVLYAKLQEAGFILIFKPIVFDSNGKAKGNCDADLVLYAMIEFSNYDKAVIVSSDGDFYSLVRHLYKHGKLKMVLSPHVDNCSGLIKREAKEKISYMDNMCKRLGIQNEKAQHKDETL